MTGERLALLYSDGSLNVLDPEATLEEALAERAEADRNEDDRNLQTKVVRVTITIGETVFDPVTRPAARQVACPCCGAVR